MTDYKELIERLRIRADALRSEGRALDAKLEDEAADALEAAQAQMQEAVAEATAAAYGATAEILNNAALAELEVNNPQDAELLFHMWKKVKDTNPKSAHDWLAAHDKEIVERCAKPATR